MDSDSTPSGITEGWVERYAIRRLAGGTVDRQQFLNDIADPDLRAVVNLEIEAFELMLARMEPSRLDGRVVGDFVIDREIGRGGMGIVYRATQTSLRRPVALKILPQLAALDPHRVTRFFREAEALATLKHPGIVSVISAGESEGVLYFAMELISGVSLASILRELESVPPERRTGRRVAEIVAAGVDTTADRRAFPDSYVAWVANVVAETAEAVDYAQRLGVLHRDIKPSNIMITADGHARLIDFGLARVAEGPVALTRTRALLGTPAYRAPETLKDGSSEASPLGDVYSLGVVLYESIGGRRPWEPRSFAELVDQIQRVVPTPLRKLHRALPRDIETICHKAFERQPVHRYASAGEFAADLRAFLEYRPIQGRPPNVWRRAVLGARRHPRAAVASSALVAALALVAGLGIAQRLREAHRVDQVAKDAMAAIAESRFDAAAEAIARLAALQEDHPVLRGARLEVARGKCLQLLDDANRVRLQLQEKREHWSALTAERNTLRNEYTRKYTPPDRGMRLLEVERECDDVDAGSRDVFFRLHSILGDAETHAAQAGLAPFAPVDAALAAMFFDEWRYAIQRDELAFAGACADMVRRYDSDCRFREALLGLATLDVTWPDSTDLYLFRYVPRVRVRAEDGSNRQVPVPCDGSGAPLPLTIRADIRPGDYVLQVLGPAARDGADPNGLRAGDLVVALDGQRLEPGYYARSIEPGSAGDKAGVRPYDRLVSLDDRPIGGWWDLRDAQREIPTPLAVFASGGESRSVRATQVPSFRNATGVDVATLPVLLAGTRPKSPLPIKIVRDGQSFDTLLAEGASPGLHVVDTIYALLFDPRLRVEAASGASLRLEPGEYLLVARTAERFEIRMPVRVSPSGHARADLRRPSLVSPPGDGIWVSSCTIERGTDPEAEYAAATETVAVDGFWIDRFELSFGEWQEFVEDPEIAARIERSLAETGTIPFLPREDDRRTPKKFSSDGWLRFPVRYVTFEDVQEYLAWRNRRLFAVGSPWYVDLPTGAEWEAALGSALQRPYPWGSKFEWRLTHGLFTWPKPTLQPVDAIPGDESPFGVRGGAGNVMEWTLDKFETDAGFPVAQGGNSAFGATNAFRIQARSTLAPHLVATGIGLRLVYRPREAKDSER